MERELGQGAPSPVVEELRSTDVRLQSRAWSWPLPEGGGAIVSGAGLAVVTSALVIGLLTQITLTVRVATPTRWLAVASVAMYALAAAAAGRRAFAGQMDAAAGVRAWRVSGLTVSAAVLLACLETAAALVVSGAVVPLGLLLNLGLLLIALAWFVQRLRPLERVMVVGDGEMYRRVARSAHGSRRLVRRLRQSVDATDADDHGGPLLDEPAAAESGRLDFLVIQASLSSQVQDLVPELRARSARVRIVLPDEVSAGARLLGSPIPVAGRALQRCLDLLIAPLALLLLSPVLLASMIAIRLNTPGSVIFKQVRLGIDGKRFQVFKLRTMLLNNSADDHQRYYASLIRGENEPKQGYHKLTDDPRVTRVGRVLRHFSVDEVPQLWNVIRGDMSLVGPRPPLPNETELYHARDWQRLRVKPGITGLWQVSGRSALGFRDMVELDISYWKNWTPLTDLAILVRTPYVVITGKGAA